MTGFSGVSFTRAGVLLGLGLCVTGCSAPPGATPQGALQTFLRALGSGDTSTACSVVAYDEKPLQGDDILLCRSGFDAVVRDIATPTELAQLRAATVTEAIVTGDRAVVRADMITGVPAAYQQEVSLVRSAGAWYIVTQRG